MTFTIDNQVDARNEALAAMRAEQNPAAQKRPRKPRTSMIEKERQAFAKGYDAGREKREGVELSAYVIGGFAGAGGLWLWQLAVHFLSTQ